MSSLHDIILKPIISEKSAATTEIANRYTFAVALAATKDHVRDAVQKLFGVRVLGVRTMVVPGKVKRFGRGYKKKPAWKKAIVSVQAGQKIEFFQSK